jgi:catechol 2,3-dioxygenase-like lactoylglutathione lyase family enzyme
VPLDHVSLTVSDRERSAVFYGEHFGLTERVHDDEHLLILGDGEGSLLALSQGESAATRLPRTNHFGFRLPHPVEVVAARERFRAAGVEELEFQERGPTRVQVTDPDGYRVEVYAF